MGLQNVNLLDLLFVFCASVAWVGLIIYEVVNIKKQMIPYPYPTDQIRIIYRNPSTAIEFKSEYMLASEWEFNRYYRPCTYEDYVSTHTKVNIKQLLDEVSKSGLVKTKIHERYPGDREKIIRSSIIILPQHDR